MKLQLKIIGLMLLFLTAAAVIVYGLMLWADIEVAKVNNYNIFVRSGYEVRDRCWR